MFNNSTNKPIDRNSTPVAQTPAATNKNNTGQVPGGPPVAVSTAQRLPSINEILNPIPPQQWQPPVISYPILPAIQSDVQFMDTGNRVSSHDVVTGETNGMTERDLCDEVVREFGMLPNEEKEFRAKVGECKGDRDKVAETVGQCVEATLKRSRVDVRSAYRSVREGTISPDDAQGVISQNNEYGKINDVLSTDDEALLDSRLGHRTTKLKKSLEALLSAFRSGVPAPRVAVVPSRPLPAKERRNDLGERKRKAEDGVATQPQGRPEGTVNITVNTINNNNYVFGRYNSGNWVPPDPSAYGPLPRGFDSGNSFPPFQPQANASTTGMRISRNANESVSQLDTFGTSDVGPRTPALLPEKWASEKAELFIEVNAAVGGRDLLGPWEDLRSATDAKEVGRILLRYADEVLHPGADRATWRDRVDRTDPFVVKIAQFMNRWS